MSAVELGPLAARQLQRLRAHYQEVDRPQAALNLTTAVVRAMARIHSAADSGLAAPRPYLDLAREGQRWIKEGRYWFCYSLATPAVVLAIFFETANIPDRMSQD